MRRLLWFLAGLAVLIGVGWYVAEGWMASQTRQALATQTVTGQAPEGQVQMHAATVSPLRELSRFGLRLDGVDLQTDGLQAALPKVELWATPWWIGSFAVTLPTAFRAGPKGLMLPVTLTQAEAGGYFSVLHGMSLTNAQGRIQDLKIADFPVVAGAGISARLVGLGAGAPRSAAASYEVTLSLRDLALDSLTIVTGQKMPGRHLGVEGPLTIWLDAAPGRGVLMGAQDGTQQAVRLVGLHSAQGLHVRLDDLSFLVRGRLQADVSGFASGQALIYTRDVRGLVARIVQAGWIDRRAGVLATAALTGIGNSDVVKGDPFPPAGEGEVRLPVIFENGLVRLGPLPLGAAPRLQ